MIETTIDLEREVERYQEAAKTCTRRVVICAGTGCVANGSLKVHAAFLRAIRERGIDVDTVLRLEGEGDDPQAATLVTKSGCQGFCQMGPLVTIEPDGLLYVKVTPEDVAEIVRETLVLHEPVERLLYRDRATDRPCRGVGDIDFYTRQQRTVLKECGSLDPENIHEYIGHGGYAAARKAYFDMTPDGICNEIIASGLRGRGGGGLIH